MSRWPFNAGLLMDGKRHANLDLISAASQHAIRMLAAETERWMRMALEQGPGWNVWRSHPTYEEGELFVIKYLFQLVGPDDLAPGEGMLFTQPELTQGERVRLLAGRHDWQEDRWEDYCGVPDCGHPCCERYVH